MYKAITKAVSFIHIITKLYHYIRLAYIPLMPLHRSTTKLCSNPDSALTHNKQQSKR